MGYREKEPSPMLLLSYQTLLPLHCTHSPISSAPMSFPLLSFPPFSLKNPKSTPLRFTHLSLFIYVSCPHCVSLSTRALLIHQHSPVLSTLPLSCVLPSVIYRFLDICVPMLVHIYTLISWACTTLMWGGTVDHMNIEDHANSNLEGAQLLQRH